MRTERLVATALIAHGVHHIQNRADGKQKDETADEDGKDDEKDDGPSVFPPLGLPACGLVHFVELVVACGTCLVGMLVVVSCGFERVWGGETYMSSRSSQSCPWGCSGICGPFCIARRWGSG
jgi:hypothetical protein